MNRPSPARSPLRLAGALASLFLLVAAASPARAETPPLDGCAAKVDSPEVQALVQAGHDLGTADYDQVKKAVADVRQKAQKEPFLLLWGGTLLAKLDPKTSSAMYEEAIRAGRELAKELGKDGAPVADLVEAAAMIRLDQDGPAQAHLDAALKAPDALSRYACRFIPVAQALADAGQVEDAFKLLAAAQKASPKARSLVDAMVDMALRSRDEKRIDDAFAVATAAFPADVELIVRRANHVKVSKGPDAALALLQPLLVAGESSPSLLGEYLGLVSAQPSEARLQEYKKLSEQRPDNLALQMMVGVIHHYLHHYEESSRYLEKAGKLIDTEPRVAMYLAMNYFHTAGKEAEAEVMIARAAKAGRPDPDIYYCRAVIEVRKDPAGAARDLERYLALTEGRADVRDEKQARVKQTLELLRGCAKSPDPKTCVQREVVEQAKALAFAEHFGKGQIGGAPAPAASAPPPPADEDMPSTMSRNDLDAAGGITLIAVLVLLGGFGASIVRARGKQAP
ncbi:MAG: hypothetical protein U0359_29960 [Byssovorax sp.]